MRTIEEEFDSVELPEDTDFGEELTNRIRYENLGVSVANWATGAVQGAAEVRRAAVAVEALTDVSLDNETVTPEEEAAYNRLNVAGENFYQETVKPALAAGVITGSVVGIPSAALAAMAIPLVGDDITEKMSKYGLVEGSKEFVLDNIPAYGSYRMTQTDEFKALAKRYPLRAGAILLAGEADTVAGVTLGARHLVKNVLDSKYATKPEMRQKVAENIQNAEKMHDTLAKQEGQTPQSTPTTEGKVSSIEEAFDHPDRMFAETTSTNEHTSKPKVNKDVAENIYDETTLERVDSLINDAEAEYRTGELFGNDTVDVNHAVIPVSPSNLKNNVRVQQIWDAFNELTTSRQGYMGRISKNVLGFYQSVNDGIRVRKRGDFLVLCHELGHYLDNKIFKLEGFDEELVRGATLKWRHNEYGSVAKNFNTYRGEGIAEFTKEYMLNPEVAQKNFPGYYEAFVKSVDANPDIKEKLDYAASLVRRYYEMSPTEQWRAHQAFAEDNTYNGNIFQRSRQAFSDLTSYMEKSLFDETAPVRKAVKDFDKLLKDRGEEGIGYDKNPANIMQNAKHSIKGRIRLMLGYDTSLAATELGIKELSEIWGINLNKRTFGDLYSYLESLNDAVITNADGTTTKLNDAYLKKYKFKDWHEAFSSYLAAVHTEERVAAKNAEAILAGELKESYKAPGDAQMRSEVIKSAPKEFQEALGLVRELNENFLALAVHYGFMSKKLALQLKNTYPNYVPLKRSFLTEGADVADYINGSQWVDVSSPIYKASKTGSDRDILDPLAQLQANFVRLITNGERNEVSKAFGALSNKNGGSRWVQKVQSNVKSPTRLVFTAWENGKKVAYQCTERAVYDALTNFDRGVALQLPAIFEKMERMSATILRNAATHHPSFALNALLLDATQSILFSKTIGTIKVGKVDTKIKNPLGVMRFFIDGIVKQFDKQIKAEMAAQGVPMTTLRTNVSDIARQRMRQTRPKGWKQKLWKKGTGVVDWVEGWYSKMEQLPRTAEYVGAKRLGKSKMEAADMANDITIDFLRTGSATRGWSQRAAFSNATLQGSYKFLREVQKDPAGIAVNAFVYLTLPSLMLYAKYRDEEWYRDIPLRDKNKYWYISKDFRIPKAYIIGTLAASLPERLAEVYFDKETHPVLKETLKTSWDDLGFDPRQHIPNLWRNGYEWLQNYNIFLDKEIVPKYMQEKEAREQFNARTTETAKYIGDVFNVSPMKIDNTIRGQFAEMGYTLVSLFENPFRENQAPAKDRNAFSRNLPPEDKRYTHSREVYDFNVAELKKRKDKDKRAAYLLQKINRDAERKIKRIRKLKNQMLLNKSLDADAKYAEEKRLNTELDRVYKNANKKYFGYTYHK